MLDFLDFVEDVFDFLGGGIFILLVIGIYVLPSFIALKNKKNNSTAICLVNLLLGCTIVGWIAALIWAITSSKKEQPAVNQIKTQTLNHIQFESNEKRIQKLIDLKKNIEQQ